MFMVFRVIVVKHLFGALARLRLGAFSCEFHCSSITARFLLIYVYIYIVLFKGSRGAECWHIQEKCGSLHPCITPPMGKRVGICNIILKMNAV